jgi:biotin carboxyl carrier protein
MQYEVEIEGQKRVVTVRVAPTGGWLVSVDGGPERHVTGGRLGAAEWRFTEDGATKAVSVVVTGDHADLQIRGHALKATVVDPRSRLALAGGAAEGVVASPMPGLVSRILVHEGQEVAAGQVLLVVEAMKMENEFKSKIAGKVQKIHVSAGNAIESNAVLVTVEPA